MNSPVADTPLRRSFTLAASHSWPWCAHKRRLGLAHTASSDAQGMTILAISLSAPFGDMLNKIVSIRPTGKAPEEELVALTRAETGAVGATRSMTARLLLSTVIDRSTSVPPHDGLGWRHKDAAGNRGHERHNRVGGYAVDTWEQNRTTADHVSGDGRLRHGESQFQELTVNPQRTQRGFATDIVRIRVRNLRDGRPTRPTPALPRPEETEPAAMPGPMTVSGLTMTSAARQ